MQFRVQARKLQCIRSTYDPAAKRSHQRVVLSLARWTDKLPSDDTLKDLTDEERQELADWIAARAAENAEASARSVIYSGERPLLNLVAALQAGKTVEPDVATRLWEGMGALAKALRKAGHPKPRKTPQKPA